MIERPHALPVIAVFLLTILPLVGLKLNFGRTDYFYEGSVREILDDSPLPLVRVEVGGQRTYTNAQGKFRLTAGLEFWRRVVGPRPSPRVTFVPTNEYELLPQPVLCTVVRKIYRCDGLFYPQAFTVAAKALSTEVAGGESSEEATRQRKSRLWRYLAKVAKDQWGSEKIFVDDFILNELIKTKLKVQTASFTVDPHPEAVSDFRYLKTISLPSPVVGVKTETVDLQGKKRSGILYFLREEGIWRYLLTETPSSVRSFNIRFGSVLKQN